MKFDLNTLVSNITITAGRAKLKIQKKSPEIFTALGVLSFLGTVAVACKETLKAQEVIKEYKDNMDLIYKASAYNEEYALVDAKREKLIAYSKFGVGIAKTYTPAVAMGILSITCFLVAKKIMDERYLGVLAAYNSLSEAFKLYRKRVIDDYGPGLDQHFRYGTTYSGIEERDPATGETVEKAVATTDIQTIQIGDEDSIVFDESNDNFDPNPMMNLMFLKAQQNAATDMLRTRGHLFLNEVYDMLGFQHTQAGTVLGWLKGKSEYVDFGLPDNDGVRRIVNGSSENVILHFNHDGVIFNEI